MEAIKQDEDIELLPVRLVGNMSNIHHAREMLVASALINGDTKEPFGGQDYDYVLFIDSDQAWTYQDFKRLLSHELDIVSAAIRIGVDNLDYNCGWFDKEVFQASDGSISTKCNAKALNENIEPVEVDFVGFGFVLIKKGVFEKMTFPFFKPEDFEIEGIKGYSGEDTGWSIRAKKLGFKLYIDPLCRVKHVKQVIL